MMMKTKKKCWFWTQILSFYFFLSLYIS
jgi:hypothetical protein